MAVRTLLLRGRLPADRLDAASAGAEPMPAVGPVVLRLGPRAHAVLLRYGSVVLFGATPAEEAGLLGILADPSGAGPSIIVAEEAAVAVDPADGEGVASDGTIRLADLAPERLQLVADVLSKAAALSYHEAQVSAAFDRVEPLAAGLSVGRAVAQETRDLLRRLGEVLLAEHRMVGRVEVSESPEVVWEHPELERLYQRLAREYELRDRDRALTRKLDLITRTVATVMEIDQNRRSLRVEWYIVVLIVAEILLTIYEMVRGGG